MSVTLGRPLAATLLLIGLLLAAALTLATEVANLWAAQDEHDAKADFIARIRPVGRPGGLPIHNPMTSLGVLAESETLAAASVDALVRSAVVEAGGAVLSSQAEVKHDSDGPPGRIEVQAVIQGKIEAVQAVLYRFESGAPMILVDRLELAPGEAQQTDPQAPLLQASLTLSAFWEPRRDAPAGATGTMQPGPDASAQAPAP